MRVKNHPGYFQNAREVRPAYQYWRRVLNLRRKIENEFSQTLVALCGGGEDESGADPSPRIPKGSFGHPFPNLLPPSK